MEDFILLLAVSLSLSRGVLETTMKTFELRTEERMKHKKVDKSMRERREERKKKVAALSEIHLEI